jgi:hypothetical protein
MVRLAWHSRYPRRQMSLLVSRYPISKSDIGFETYLTQPVKYFSERGTYLAKAGKQVIQTETHLEQSLKYLREKFSVGTIAVHPGGHSVHPGGHSLGRGEVDITRDT